MTPPPFSEQEKALVRQIVSERYGAPVVPEEVEVELMIDPDLDDPVPCPALYWSQRGAEFVVAKTGPARFTCQFQYSASEQFGTGRQFYNDLSDCVVTLLKLQADHEKTRAGVLSGMTAKELDDGEEYFGPLII